MAGKTVAKTAKVRKRGMMAVVLGAEPRDRGIRTTWRLAVREPIEAYDEYTDETIELKVGQDDPSDIAGLVIDFRYYNRDGETTRRSLLCWQCWRIADRIYVRGYCPFREELRTFRIDRMSDVIALSAEQDTEVVNVRSFFAAFAADVTTAALRNLIEG